jgi:hypothetical protein
MIVLPAMVGEIAVVLLIHSTFPPLFSKPNDFLIGLVTQIACLRSRIELVLGWYCCWAPQHLPL